jgi:pyrroline-5-carboxylate reductase
MADTGEEPAKLRTDVTSPGGTTQAGLDILTGDDGLQSLLRGAVAAAGHRARELGGSGES